MTSSTGSEAGRSEAGRWAREPEDARRGHIAPTPADAAEARADRELADAERAAVEGRASQDTIDRLARVDEARTQEERRRRWLQG